MPCPFGPDWVGLVDSVDASIGAAMSSSSKMANQLLKSFETKKERRLKAKQQGGAATKAKADKAIGAQTAAADKPSSNDAQQRAAGSQPQTKMAPNSPTETKQGKTKKAEAAAAKTTPTEPLLKLRPTTSLQVYHSTTQLRALSDRLRQQDPSLRQDKSLALVVSWMGLRLCDVRQGGRKTNA